jgi:uncharacterized protein YgiB involved in biofilm formation
MRKSASYSNRAVLIVFAATLLLGYGCSDDERHQLFDLDGDIYTETFSCNQTFTGQQTTCPDLNETDRIQFERTGPNTFEVRDVPDTGFVINGTLVGLVFTWNATSPNGYTESGTWTFSQSGGSFSGPSHYVANNGSYTGDCNTNGDIGLSTPPDPPRPAGCP